MSKSKKRDEIKIENVLENIIAHMPGHVYWKDKNGTYLGCNDKQAISLGLKSGKEVVGKNDFDLPWKKEAAEHFRANDFSVIQSGQAKTIEEVAYVDEKEAIVLSQKVPLRDSHNNIIGVLGISIDISELKQTQVALKEQIKKTEHAYQSKTEFVSKASHEIRTPISNLVSINAELDEQLQRLKNTICGDILNVLSEANKEELINDVMVLFNKIKEYTVEAKIEAHRSLSSLTNLGDLYRLQTEGIKHKFELSNIQGMIEKAIENRTKQDTKEIELIKDIKANVPGELLIDYRNIYEVLRIIIGNAIRFSYEKGIVKIQADINDKYLVIAIQDFGEGIPEQQLDALFQTLLTEDIPVEKSRYHKPSLQLSLAKMRIEASGGKLEIKSSYKKGTLVTLYIPYQRKSVEANYNQNTENLEQIRSAQQNILLIEDDITAQKVEKRCIEELGYCVDIASTGAEAIQLAASNCYNLILIDITLPDINGIEVMQKIRVNIGDKIPFIALTSHTSEADIDYFIGEGVVTVLTKPVNKEILKKCIDDVLAVADDKNNFE